MFFSCFEPFWVWGVTSSVRKWKVSRILGTNGVDMVPGPETTASLPKFNLLEFLSLEVNGTKQLENLPPIEELNWETRETAPPPMPTMLETLSSKFPTLSCPCPMIVSGKDIGWLVVDPRVSVHSKVSL